MLAETGWRSEAVVGGAGVTPVSVPDGVPLSAALGALGMPGLTAYAAHVRQLRPSTGETVVIGSATGGVGAVAGQLARLAGARTVGIVGSEEKAKLADGPSATTPSYDAVRGWPTSSPRPARTGSTPTSTSATRRPWTWSWSASPSGPGSRCAA